MSRRVLFLVVSLVAALLLAAACSSTTEGDGNGGADVLVADSGGVHFEPLDASSADHGATPGPDLHGPGPDSITGGPDTTGGGPDFGGEPDCRSEADCPEGHLCQGGLCVPTGGDPCPGGVCPTNPGALMQVDPVGDIGFSYMPGVAIPISRNVLVSSTGDGPLVVYSIALGTGSPGDYTLRNVPALPATLHPGDTLNFDVVFEEHSAMPPQGTIVILNNVVGASRTVIRLVPQPKGATPQPCIVVNPTSLNFGTVQRGQVVSQDVQITSCSGPMIPLTITEVARGSGFFGGLSQEFQIGQPLRVPTTLAPGQSVTQSFTFAAGLAGAKTGYFLIKSNDPEQPEVRLDVRGTSEPPPLVSQGIHVQLDWDSNDCDVDLHLIAPGGTFYRAPLDCYYGNMSPDWGTQGDFTDDPFLDVDNVWGFGPENINLQEPKPGTYRVVVHYYLDSYNSSNSTSTNATVNVFSYGTLLGTYGPTYLAQTDKMWDVVDITWNPASGASVTPLGNVYDR